MVATYEARRLRTGTTVSQTLDAVAFETIVAGKPVTTWGYNGSLTALEIRARAGDLLVSLAHGHAA